MSFCLQALSASVYLFQARRFSVCSCLRAAMTADAGAGVEIGTVNPGFVGKKKLLADSRAYTTGGAVRGRCPSVLRRRLEWTEGEHELRYAFSLARYSRFGGP